MRTLPRALVIAASFLVVPVTATAKDYPPGFSSKAEYEAYLEEQKQQAHAETVIQLLIATDQASAQLIQAMSAMPTPYYSLALSHLQILRSQVLVGFAHGYQPHAMAVNFVYLSIAVDLARSGAITSPSFGNSAVNASKKVMGAMAGIPGAHVKTAFAVGRENLLLLSGDAEHSSWSPEAALELSPQGELLLNAIYAQDPLFHDAAMQALELSEYIDEAPPRTKRNSCNFGTDKKLKRDDFVVIQSTFLSIEFAFGKRKCFGKEEPKDEGTVLVVWFFL